MKKILMATLLLAATISQAHGQGPLMMKEWISECNASSKDTLGMFRQTLCLRYVRGLADGFTLWEILDPKSAMICIPGEVDNRQLAEVGKKYFRENPKDQHLEAGIVLGISFRDAWPCQAPSPTVNFK